MLSYRKSVNLRYEYYKTINVKEWILYINIFKSFYLLLRPLQNIQRFSAVETWNGFYLVRINFKKCIATNFHVTFRFLNFRMTFSRNVSGLGSIVTAIILELTYLWRNCIRIRIKNNEEKLHTFGRFKPIFHEGGTVRDKQGVSQPQLGCLESFWLQFSWT